MKEITKSLKILSWNLYSFNLRQSWDIKSILKSEPDVICFQEVRSKTLVYLGKLENYNLTFCEDFHEKNNKFYNATLVKKSIKIHRTEKIDIFLNNNHRVFFWKESIEALRVDIRFRGKTIPIINTHLALLCGPLMRLKQLEIIVNNVGRDLRAIILGDFNSFSNPLYLLFTLPFIQFPSFREFFIFENRRIKFYMNRCDFIQYLTGITFPLSLAKLDHIYLKNIKELKSREWSTKLGSDHFPIYSELAI